MKMGNKAEIVKKKTGNEIVLTYGNKTVSSLVNPEYYGTLASIYRTINYTTESQREQVFQNMLTDVKSVELRQMLDIQDADMEALKVRDPNLTRGMEALIKFFTEFNFEPNFRFVNTLAWCLKDGGSSNARTYITNYFKLADSAYTNEIRDKISSVEFEDILHDLTEREPTNHVNTRLRIYYGSQGTGKTTQAQSEANGKCMVCNSAMLPSDLMEDFKFVDGKADFSPSVMWECMENGEKIVLDEINLLPYESLRFLQGILDGKKEFTYKNRTVNIKDGFQVIGTMNLAVNGIVYGLPEPLIDRCEMMKEYKLTAKDLLSAI